MKLILIIDDEESIRHSLSGILHDEGYEVISEGYGEAGLKVFESKSPNVVLLDIWLPDSDGINILSSMIKINKNIPVIMISGHSDIETAIKTIKLGAYDFIEKPLSLDRVIITIENALKYNDLSEKKIAFASSSQESIELLGISDNIKELKNKISKAAPSEAPVLIIGENGTGKELVAKSLHYQSLRSEEPFIAINCAAVPEDLIESELFGHEKGSFTGANYRKKGKFELADGGTLFLDEIGDMSLRMQSKILRVLQDNKFQRVGGETTIEVDARIIAATNKNLEQEIKKEHFRSDLYFRLNVIPFYIPSLRERKADIPILIDYFLKKFTNEKNKSIFIEPQALEVFKNYSWPGNVRELKNIIERLIIMNYQNNITKNDVISELKLDKSASDFIDKYNKRIENEQYCNTDEKNDSNKYIDAVFFKDAKEAFEKDYLTKKLIENNFNISKTAKYIGMSRRNLHKKILLLKINIDNR